MLVSLKVSIHLLVADVGRPVLSSELINRALHSAGIRPIDQGIRGFSRSADMPGKAKINATVIADDAQAVTAAVVDAFVQQGVQVIEATSNATLVEAKELNARGAHYDIATGTLTVETSGPEWSDLSIKLLRTEDSITGLMVSNTHGRVEDGLPGLFHIIIRRPAANFTEA
jgi:hypothetical protein